MDVAGATDRGRSRPSNQDQFLIADLERNVRVRQSSLPTESNLRTVAGARGLLLVVADGIGGHAHGDVASATAVNTVLYHAAHAMPWLSAAGTDQGALLLDDLSLAFASAQEQMEAIARRQGSSHQRMGTTLTVAYVLWPTAYVAHAGDSRLYLFRGGRLVQVTRDHTVGEQMRELGLDASGAVGMDHVLVNTVAAGTDAVRAEHHRIALEPGDRLLLCSDGLFGHLDDDQIARVLNEVASSQVCCSNLIAAANAAGGSDNITVVCARFAVAEGAATQPS